MEDSEILSLYTSFKDDARGWLTLHRQHFTQFVAIILAVLGATVAAFVKLFQQGEVLLILIIGPILSGSLSVFAIRVCNKFYKRYAEHDAIGYKFYRLLEIHSDLKKDLQSVKEVYPGQKGVFPDRQAGRLSEANSVDEYATNRLFARDASNRFIVFTFGGLVCLSAILAVLIFCVAV